MQDDYSISRKVTNNLAGAVSGLVSGVVGSVYGVLSIPTSSRHDISRSKENYSKILEVKGLSRSELNSELASELAKISSRLLTYGIVLGTAIDDANTAISRGQMSGLALLVVPNAISFALETKRLIKNKSKN